MDLSKIFKEKVLLDTTAILAIVTAVLYGAGLSFIEGSLTGIGLTSDIVEFKLQETIYYGFVAILFTPFFAFIYWGMSLIGIIPVVLFVMKKTVDRSLILVGMVFFLMVQLYAYHEAGVYLANIDKQDIEQAYNNKTPESFDFNKVSVRYVSNGELIVVSGFALDVPGDYIVVAQKNKTVAISKAHVTTVEFYNEK